MASKKRKTAGKKRKTTRKKLATKGLSKRKATSKKKAVPKKLQRLLDSLAWRADTRLPKKEDVPGYVRGVYDVPGHFEAMALYWEIWPFYRGSDNKPFDCLEAEVVNAPIYRGDRVVATRYHSYYPREGCRHLYRRRDVI
jgi:hypothetical protein